MRSTLLCIALRVTDAMHENQRCPSDDRAAASVRRVFLAVVTGRRLAEDLGAGGWAARAVSIDVVDVDAQDLGVFPPAARGLTMLSSPACLRRTPP